MSVRRKYELNRRSMLHRGDFESPGKYRKLTDEEIEAEWSFGKPSLRTHSPANLAPRGTDTTNRNQIRSTGQTTDDQSEFKCGRNNDDRPKSMSLAYTESAPVRTPRLGLSLYDPRRRHTRAITVSVESSTDVTRSTDPGDSGGKHASSNSSSPRQEKDDTDDMKRDVKLQGHSFTLPNKNTEIVSKDCYSSKSSTDVFRAHYEGDGGEKYASNSSTSPKKDDIDDIKRNKKLEEHTFTLPNENTEIAPKESNSRCNSGDGLLDSGSSEKAKDGKVSHCSTCKSSDYGFPTLADASCQTRARKHSTKRRKPDTRKSQNECDTTEKSSYSTEPTSLNSQYSSSNSSSTSSNSTADDRSCRESFVLQQLEALAEVNRHHPMDNTGPKLGFSVVNTFSYVEISESWMDTSKETPYVCLDVIRKDDVPGLTSTPRDDSHVMSGMATCVDDNTISKYTEVNGETLDDDPAVIKTSIPDPSVATLPTGERGHLEFGPAVVIDAKEAAEIPNYSVSGSTTKEKDADATTSCPEDSTDSVTIGDVRMTKDDVNNKLRVMDAEDRCEITIETKPTSFMNVSSESEHIVSDEHDNATADEGTIGEATADEGTIGEATASETTGLDASTGKGTDNAQPEELNLSGEASVVIKYETPNIVVIITSASDTSDNIDNIGSDSRSETVTFPSAADIHLAELPLKQAKVYLPNDDDTDTSTESESTSDDDSKKRKRKMPEDSRIPVNGICIDDPQELKPEGNIVEHKDTDTPSTDAAEMNASSLSGGTNTSNSNNTTCRTLTTSEDESSELPKDNIFEATIEVSSPENNTCTLPSTASMTQDQKDVTSEMPSNVIGMIPDITVGEKQCTDDLGHINSVITKPDSVTSDHGSEVSPDYKEEIFLDSGLEERLSGSGQNELPSGQKELSFATDQKELPTVADQHELSSFADHKDLPSVADHKDLPSVGDHKDLPSVADHKDLPYVADPEKGSSTAGHDAKTTIGDMSTDPRGECDGDSKEEQLTEKVVDVSSSSDDKTGNDKNTSHTSSTSDAELRDTPKSKHHKNRMSSMLSKIKHKIFPDDDNQNTSGDVGGSNRRTPAIETPMKPKRKFRSKSTDKKEKRNKKSSKSKSFSEGDKNTDKEMIEIDASLELDKLENSKNDDEKVSSKMNVKSLVENTTDVITGSLPSGLNTLTLNTDTSSKDILSCDIDSASSSPDKAPGVIYITNNAEGNLPLETSTDDVSDRDVQIAQADETNRVSVDKEDVITAQIKIPTSSKTSKDSKHKDKSSKTGLSKSSSSSSSGSSNSSNNKNKHKKGGKDVNDHQQSISVSQHSDLGSTPSVYNHSSSVALHSPNTTVQSQPVIVHSPDAHERLAKQEALFSECIPLEAVTASLSASPRQQSYFVVVAIDFGTTYSGYALSFTRDPDNVHMMRNWEGGDPGVVNQKIPTSILLTPEGEFDSFGFTARDRYHNLEHSEAKKWLYFEKFKMILHHSSQLTKDTQLYASNGQAFPALTVFSYALRFFKEHALEQLSDQCGTTMLNTDVRWVITVPAIWKAPAKQFMRQAAYDAGMVSPGSPDQMLIALEPEAASIYCRKLRMYELVPESPVQRPLQSPRKSVQEPLNTTSVCTDLSEDMSPLKLPFDLAPNQVLETKMKGTRYLVVDCGGGTVDITVHELDDTGKLKELYKATGGPYGSIGIDIEFEKLLYAVFGEDFIDNYKAKYPVGWVNLMINFESRKRSASPYKSNPLNISIPFSFIDYHKKQKSGHMESTVKKYGDSDICWSSEGMLRLSPMAMKRLFLPTVERIKQTIGDVLNNKYARDLSYMFLVGGFAESPVLQQEIRREFSHILKILIPTGVSLAILKGAVLFGLDPTVVNVRRSRLTYGVGVLNRFDPNKHPKSKLVTREGKDWCTDVFEKYVTVDEAITLGDTVVRSYTPAKSTQQVSIINIYSSESANSQFITDPGVRKCGTLCLDVSDMQAGLFPARREIQTRMMFGDTEIKVSALDVTTGRCVKASIDFLNK
ncbi:uncharacterized protein LOC121383315 isoform X2 [Gigantopelta aegis]|uniref:uncharacterized protein LOC121383315 isoform X2 n=1 Tax=Gigantopelta aegis TaxID=1735272 RepID=UPI001B88CAD1|nr:uncharacterized protein LOC121383315 isoform X2 [Gigantopelta aegis]